MIPRPRISPPSREELLEAECTRLRELICRIVEAVEEEDFDAAVDAIQEAKNEAILSALRAAGER